MTSSDIKMFDSKFDHWEECFCQGLDVHAVVMAMIIAITISQWPRPCHKHVWLRSKFRQFSKLLNVLCCFANWKLELISTDNSFDYVLSVEQGFFFPGITSDICFHRNLIFSQKPSFLKFNIFDILLGSNFTSYAIINMKI